MAADELTRIEREVRERHAESVEIRSLRMGSKSAMEALQRGADAKRKVYACVVWVGKSVSSQELRERLDGVKNLQLDQKTPLRVLHRRSLMSRDNVIHWMRSERLNSRFFILRVCTSAGTYVKEFVHGDMGRTRPSVGELLGCEADILQLDVEGVVM